MLLVYFTPVLQWTRRYFLLGAFLIFENYFRLMNALHVDWLSIRHQLSLILASVVASRMVSLTCIIMVLPFFILLLIGSVCRKSCVEVFQNMIPGDGGSPHSLVGGTIMTLHEASFAFTNNIWSPPPRGLLADFSCFIYLNSSTSSLNLI